MFQASRSGLRVPGPAGVQGSSPRHESIPSERIIRADFSNNGEGFLGCDFSINQPGVWQGISPLCGDYSILSPSRKVRKGFFRNQVAGKQVVRNL